MSPSKSISDWSLFMFSVHAQTANHVVVLPSCFLVTESRDILQKWKIKRGNWPKRQNVQQRNEK